MTLVLAWVKREAGVKFFRFNAGTAALLIAIGFALRPEPDASKCTLYGSDGVARHRRGGACRVLGDDRPDVGEDSSRAVVVGDRIRPDRRHSSGARDFG